MNAHILVCLRRGCAPFIPTAKLLCGCLWRGCRLGVFVAVGLLVAGESKADSSAANAIANPAFTEAQIKAQFLLNFAKYVEWPAPALAETNTPMTIGLYGKVGFGDDLKKIVAEQGSDGRRIVIRPVGDTNDLTQCHILFVSRLEKKHWGDILAKIKAAPVLTVGETEAFIASGGGISFVKKGGQVRLQINLVATAQAKLQISAKLLSVAEVVREKAN